MADNFEEEELSGRLFVWGKVSRREKDVIATPKPVPFFLDKKVQQVSIGQGFTAVLTEDQEVYTTGSRSWFKAGHADSTDSLETVHHWKELSGKGVIQICCGQNFMAAMTMVGLLYTWGTGTFGQLGIGEDAIKQYAEFKVEIPTLVESLIDVDQISCGEECMAAITKQGKLYTCGKGYHGCLGHGNDNDVFTPKQVVTLDEENILQVKCGASHMAVLTENKEIFTWGNNFLGPLGRILGKQKDSDPTPKVVELVQTGATVTEENLKGSDEVEFIQVECLKYNTIALTSEGQVFSCGKGGNDGGGHGDQPHTLLCLIDALKDVPIRFLASCTTSHAAAVADDGSVYVWGNGEDHKLGLGSPESQMAPIKMDNLKGRVVYSIACGEYSSAAILEPSAEDKADASTSLTKETTGTTKEQATSSVSDGNMNGQGKKELPSTTSSSTAANAGVEEYDDSSEDEDFIEGEVVMSPIQSNNNNTTTATTTTTTDAPAKQSTTPPTSPPSDTKTEKTTTTTTNFADAIDEVKKNAQENNRNETATEKKVEEKAPSSPKPQNTDATTTTTTPNESSGPSSQNSYEGLGGYLNKKGEKGLVKLWRKRWFKIVGESIEYYDNDKASKKNGSINLKEIMDLLPGTLKFSFNIVCKTGRIYELQALSQDDFTKWTTAIKYKISRKQ